MSENTASDRLALKTPEASFLHVLEHEFNLSYREAREVVSAARELLGLDQPTAQVRPGQVRLVVASLRAPIGPPLAETDRVEVTLTVDAGAEDGEVLGRDGRTALRGGRILRLAEEALEQGGVLTEEDLARALQVTRRTIERDVRTLRAAGHLVQTRGQVKGTGRGQTHKVRIIELWLDRQGYDKIALWAHHSVQSIKRYVSTFLRIVTLYRQATAVSEIAFLVAASEKLVGDYLGLYERAQGEPPRLAKLEEELARVSGLVAVVQKGGLPA
jgi:DNA-binding MarR family transcriptional regulator